MRIKTRPDWFGFYLAETILTLHPMTAESSPYRTTFMGSHTAIVRAYGRSPEGAADRCVAKAEKIAAAHRLWATKRNAETRYIDR